MAPRYHKGITSPVAGGADSGDQAHQLEAPGSPRVWSSKSSDVVPRATSAAFANSIGNEGRCCCCRNCCVASDARALRC